MYSLVMLAAMTAAPEMPQELLCPVNQSRYGGKFWLKHCFYDCCGPARYGWVNCWNKGFGYYPGNSRGFCGSCAQSYGQFYRPNACGSGYGCGFGGGGGCGRGSGSGICHQDWSIGCSPAYYTSVIGCPPNVSAPPYAYYTQCNPCSTYGHFAFDSGLIGHSSGVGYSGFGGYGNFGMYGAVPMQHPPTLQDIPRYTPHHTEQPYGGYPGTDYQTSPYHPVTPGVTPSGTNPLLPSPSVITPGVIPMPMPPSERPLIPPLDKTLPEIPKPPDVPIIPLPAPKEDPKLKKDPTKTGGSLLMDTTRSTVVLSVPSEAKVFIDGYQLRSQGAERTFRTPELEANREYSYTVKVVVERAGRELIETRQIVVTAGNTTRLAVDIPTERSRPALATEK